MDQSSKQQISECQTNAVSSSKGVKRKLDPVEKEILKKVHFSQDSNPDGGENSYWKFFLSSNERKDAAKCKLCLDINQDKYVSRVG